MAATAERLHLWITGRVQGVGFRWFTHSAAVQAGCTGWVRNLPDGRVEVLAEGTATALAELTAACHAGPRGGRVDDLTSERTPATGEFAEFSITH